MSAVGGPWCAECGSNPVWSYGDKCASCRADEDFYNCEFCHGTNCTQECDEDDDA